MCKDNSIGTLLPPYSLVYAKLYKNNDSELLIEYHIHMRTHNIFKTLDL